MVSEDEGIVYREIGDTGVYRRGDDQTGVYVFFRRSDGTYHGHKFSSKKRSGVCGSRPGESPAADFASVTAARGFVTGVVAADEGAAVVTALEYQAHRGKRL